MKNTPQTAAVRDALTRLGHATNMQLLDEVRPLLPGITITSVHRISGRLVQEGLASVAPVREGMTVIDARPEPHHHFACHVCRLIRDIEIPSEMLGQIQAQLPRAVMSGGLTVYGSCAECQHVGSTH